MLHLWASILWIWFPIQFSLFERLYLLRKTMPRGKCECMCGMPKFKHFFCTGAEISTFNRCVLFFCISSSFENRFNVIEQIAQNPNDSFSNEWIPFSFIHIYAFYLFDFPFTKLQIFFCFALLYPSTWSISVALYCHGFDVEFFLMLLCMFIVFFCLHEATVACVLSVNTPSTFGTWRVSSQLQQ